MKFPFPHVPSRQKPAKLTGPEERGFSEAIGLSQLRPKQCIADLQICFRQTTHAIAIEPPRFGLALSIGSEHN